MSSSNQDKHNIEFILNIINQYNKSQPHAPLKFIHAGSSADLAFVGKTATITRPKESEILMIPHAIIPKRILRKKYGIYPLMLENGLTHAPKKMAHNYHRLYGAIASEDGVNLCFQHTREVYPHMKGDNIHKLILETILRMHPATYIRSLKRISSLLNNLILMDAECNERILHYLTLLEEEKKIVQLYYSDQETVHTTFNRSLSRIKNILQTKLVPFPIDEKFRTELLEHYPVIYCSTVEGNLHEQGLAHERFFDDELYLETVKLVFTPTENLARLQAKLEEIGLANVMKVHGYEVNKENEIDERQAKEEDLQSKEKMAFLASELLDQFVNLAQKNPHLIKDQQLIQEKLTECLNHYSAGKTKDHLNMACWLLKNANEPTLTGIDKLVAHHPIFTLHDTLQFKSQKNTNYFPTLSTMVPADYLNRFQDIAYLKALFDLRIKDLIHVLNYHEKPNAQEWLGKIHPIKLIHEPKNYLYEYLMRLQSLYTVLIREEATSFEEADTIYFLRNLVREKYIELIRDYKKNNAIDSKIATSELFQLIKNSVQDNKKIWIKIFTRTKTAANG